jgi:hypothetical protein
VLSSNTTLPSLFSLSQGIGILFTESACRMLSGKPVANPERGALPLHWIALPDGASFRMFCPSLVHAGNQARQR